MHYCDKQGHGNGGMPSSHDVFQVDWPRLGVPAMPGDCGLGYEMNRKRCLSRPHAKPLEKSLQKLWGWKRHKLFRRHSEFLFQILQWSFSISFIFQLPIHLLIPIFRLHYYFTSYEHRDHDYKSYLKALTPTVLCVIKHIIFWKKKTKEPKKNNPTVEIGSC